MNILIDFSQIPRRKVGVGVYGQNLVRHLISIDQKNQYFLLIQDDENCFDDLTDKNLHLIRLNHRIFRRFIFRVAIEQIFIPILIKIKQIDIVHSLHYSFPFFSFQARVVVTIHDMTFFLYPQYHLRVKQIYFRFFIKKLAAWADSIIAVSESTQQDYLRITSDSPNKVFVIPLGRPTKETRLMISRSNPAKVVASLGVSAPYILYVGTLEPRKNIECLVHAFKKLLEFYPQINLVIAGAKGWQYDPIFELVMKQQLKSKVSFLGFISDTDKYCLMSQAAIFVYPSFYEGFGLPVLEAMSFGTATITSNRSSMPEIAGQAALLIDPEDSSQLLNGLITLLSDDSSKKALGKSAKIQSSKFRWHRTAHSTLVLYRSIN